MYVPGSSRESRLSGLAPSAPVQGIVVPGRWGGSNYILTDTALCSLTEEFGCTDMGLPAQLLFLSQHSCGLTCLNWQHMLLSGRKRLLESARLFLPGENSLF